MVYQNGLPVKEADTAFPMITQLREGSSLGSKDGDEVYTIDYLTLSDKANMGTGSSSRWYPQGDGTAFVLENLGTIHDLQSLSIMQMLQQTGQPQELWHRQKKKFYWKIVLTQE